MKRQFRILFSLSRYRSVWCDRLIVYDRSVAKFDIVGFGSDQKMAWKKYNLFIFKDLGGKLELLTYLALLNSFIFKEIGGNT